MRVATDLAIDASFPLRTVDPLALIANYATEYNGIFWGRLDSLVDGLVSSWPNDIPGGSAAPTAAGSARPSKDSTGILFDGSANVLDFPTNLPTGPCSFFAVCNNLAAGTTVIFLTREHCYFTSLDGSSGRFSAYANADIDSGIVIGSSMSILEAVEHAANDIDIGVNGVLVNRTNGTGYPARGYAKIGAEGGFWFANMKIKELLFLGDAVPADVATAIRTNMAERNGVTL